MIVLFGAIYILVGYLNDGTDLSGPAIATQRGEVSNVRQGPNASPSATPSMPSATGTPTADDPPPSNTPTSSPASLLATATVEPTATSTVQSAPTTESIITPTPASPTPTASPTEDVAALLVQRAITAEENVKTGHLEASVESEQGNDASSSITFDFGDGAQPPRMHFVSTYTSSEVQRTTELIVIGEQFWERIDEGAWTEVGAREGVWGQVQSYLPGVAAITDTTQVSAEGDRLTWSDHVRDVDVTLQVDEATGVPQQLRRASRSTDTVVIVTYEDWNAPVEIQMPVGS